MNLFLKAKSMFSTLNTCKENYTKVIVYNRSYRQSDNTDICEIWRMHTDIFVFQTHWTNPQGVEDYVDSSGMILYYTALKRPNSGKVLQTGQYYLQIPPGKPAVYFDSICTAECTSRLQEPIYVTDAILHMHYQGEYPTKPIYYETWLVWYPYKFILLMYFVCYCIWPSCCIVFGTYLYIWLKIKVTSINFL